MVRITIRSEASRNYPAFPFTDGFESCSGLRVFGWHVLHDFGFVTVNDAPDLRI